MWGGGGGGGVCIVSFMNYTYNIVHVLSLPPSLSPSLPLSLASPSLSIYVSAFAVLQYVGNEEKKRRKSSGGGGGGRKSRWLTMKVKATVMGEYTTCQ